MYYGTPFRRADVRLVHCTNHEHVATLLDWPIYLSDNNDWFIQMPNMSRWWGPRPCRLVTQVDLSDPNDTHQVWITSEELQNIIQHGKLDRRLKVVGDQPTTLPNKELAAEYAASLGKELLNTFHGKELTSTAVGHLQAILRALRIDSLSVGANSVEVADAANGGEQ